MKTEPQLELGTSCSEERDVARDGGGQSRGSVMLRDPECGIRSSVVLCFGQEVT